MGPAKSDPIAVRNHYVAQLYLKRWAGTDSMLSRYSFLVPHKNAQSWGRHSPAAIGYHQHLYTRIAGGKETDEVEKWLNHQFETPAELPISKAVSEQPMASSDWGAILRFMLMQHARTPASFLRFREGQILNLPAMLEKAQKDAVQQLEEAYVAGKSISHKASPAAMDFPSQTATHIEPGAEVGTLTTEVPVGRSLWLWSLRQPYTLTMEAIYRLKTTILRPPVGKSWVTSDDPVVLLNYHSAAEYDFGGGYGHLGTEVLFPLSPQHLLYAKVGHRPAFHKYQRVPESTWYAMQKVLIEHAHRMIFAVEPDPMVDELRPRHVSLEDYKHEVAQWAQWHKEQSAVEAALSKPSAR